MRVFTEEEVIKLLVIERSRSRDIAYESHEEYEKKYNFHVENDSMKEIRFSWDSIAEEARHIGNAISGGNALSAALGETMEDRIREYVKNLKNNIMSTVKIDRYDLEELAAHLCGINYDENDDYSEIEQALYDKFNIDYDSFEELITALVPLIDVGKSPLTGIQYKGFSKDGSIWILKVLFETSQKESKKKPVLSIQQLKK